MLQVCMCARVTMCDINCNYTIPPTTVILESLSNKTCPGGPVVFTCITDTGELLWELSHKGENTYYNTEQDNKEEDLGIFIVNVTDVSGKMLISTATVYSVHLHDNGTVISCHDAGFQGRSTNGIIQVSGTKSTENLN